VQLHAAKRAGLRIPATLVSQDPVHIRRFCAAHRARSSSPLRRRVASNGVDSGSQPGAARQRGSPALMASIYQECIPGTRHLRISVVGERCDGALIEPRALDWRFDLNVPFSLTRSTAPRTKVREHPPRACLSWDLRREVDPTTMSRVPRGQPARTVSLRGGPVRPASRRYLCRLPCRPGDARGEGTTGSLVLQFWKTIA